MKKIVLKLALCLTLSATFVACNNDDDKNNNATEITVENLPVNARTYLATHFDGVNIVRVVKVNTYVGIKYDVTLANGFEVEFDDDGDWTEIDGENQALPNSVIPTNILTYVTTQYAQNFIVKIEKTTLGYEVDLNNDVDLLFDAEGNFVSIQP